MDKNEASSANSFSSLQLIKCQNLVKTVWEFSRQAFQHANFNTKLLLKGKKVNPLTQDGGVGVGGGRMK